MAHMDLLVSVWRKVKKKGKCFRFLLKMKNKRLVLSQYKISDSKIKLGIVNLFLFTLKLINVCFPMK